jgi:hypothetical protein
MGLSKAEQMGIWEMGGVLDNDWEDSSEDEDGRADDEVFVREQ